MSTLQLSLQVGGQLALTDFHLHDLSQFSHMALLLLTVAEGVPRGAGAVHPPTVQCVCVLAAYRSRSSRRTLRLCLKRPVSITPTQRITDPSPIFGHFQDVGTCHCPAATRASQGQRSAPQRAVCLPEMSFDGDCDS